VKHGFLWKRSSNVKRDWKRRWFLIQGGKLKYVRQEENTSSTKNTKQPPVTVCDIMLCTVRESNKANDPRFTFEIVSPQNRTYVCKAESGVEYNEWVLAIREQTENMLMSGKAHEGESEERNNRTGGSTLPAGITTLGVPDKGTVAAIRGNNLRCADCGNSDPTWVSINLGTLLCIQCSGIHRSLGVHISKVRSITLDNWSLPMLSLLGLLGNEANREVYEEMIGDSKRPGPSCSREEGHQFIMRKYVEKAFVRVREGVKVEERL